MAKNRSIAIRLTPQSYFEASVEHIKSARILHEDMRQYPLAIYVSGLAVECLLRAFRALKSGVFDERHDLRELSRNSDFIDSIPLKRSREYSRYLGVLVTHWHNTHRFRSEMSMRAMFKRRKLDRGIRGDPLKELSRRIYDAAMEIVTLGTQRWKISGN